MQDDVGKRRAERTSLRGPFLPRAHQPSFHDPTVQVASDQFERSLVGYPLGQQSHQLIMVHPIEKLLQVQLYYPDLPFLQIISRPLYCLMGIAARSEPIAVLQKLRLILWA